jgi:hypothetical protein
VPSLLTARKDEANGPQKVLADKICLKPENDEDERESNKKSKTQFIPWEWNFAGRRELFC